MEKFLEDGLLLPRFLLCFKFSLRMKKSLFLKVVGIIGTISIEYNQYSMTQYGAEAFLYEP